MTFEITFTGVVQGVGFRPRAAGLAVRSGLKGDVRNSGGIARIRIADTGREEVGAYIENLLSDLPDQAAVTSVSIRELSDDIHFNGFVIADSDTGIREPAVSPGSRAVAELPVLVPDIATCDRCLDEMRDKDDRRAGYPLISCASCGPRFSILDELPYDRERTVMKSFAMCPVCGREYTEGGNRRMHAQTISCRECGPQVSYLRGDEVINGDGAIAGAVNDLKSGGVVAVKGVGGYQLLCDPSDSGAVASVRHLKSRERRPLAVMYPSVSGIKRDMCVSDEEERALLSSARPIVLIRAEEIKSWTEGVRCGSAFAGVFLPASGLHQLLTDAAGPVVCTSLNLTGQPMITEDEEAAKVIRERGGVRGILSHPRAILAPLDDSVIFVENGGKRMVRRSRGYVPRPTDTGAEVKQPGEDIIAFGADLKAAFAVARGSRIILSQPFGDLTDAGVRRAYLKELERYIRLYGLRPGLVICDAHPGYISAAMASEFASAHGLAEPEKVYHHHAHIMSVMAEKGLTSCIGIAADGTGYGNDGGIWGGEILSCRGTAFTRTGHLRPVRLPAGEAVSGEAWIPALCYLADAGAEHELPGTDPGRSRLVLAARESQGGGIVYTGSGRLFDAVAYIFGLCRENSYEGECASALEAAAHRYLSEKADEDAVSEAESYVVTEESAGDCVVDLLPAVRRAAELTAKGCTPRERDRFAYVFHAAFAAGLADAAAGACRASGEKNVVLSGGTFLNRIIIDLIRRRLSAEGLTVHVPSEMPPGDGGIAAGQAFLAILGGKQIKE